MVILNCIEMAISVEFGRDETRADAVHTALLVSGNVFCALFGGTEYFWMPKKAKHDIRHIGHLGQWLSILIIYL